MATAGPGYYGTLIKLTHLTNMHSAYYILVTRVGKFLPTAV